MAFKANECGALKITRKGVLCGCNRSLVDGKTCADHIGFYEPVRWLRWLDNKTQGDIYKSYEVNYRHRLVIKSNPYWEHIGCALKSGRVKITRESLKTLPTYMFQDSNHKGMWLTYYLYLTQKDICYDWSPRLWKRMVDILSSWRDCLDFGMKEGEWVAVVERLIRRPSELVEFSKKSLFNKRTILYILEKRPEWALLEEVRKAVVGTGFIHTVIRANKRVEDEANARFRLIRDELVSRAATRLF